MMWENLTELIRFLDADQDRWEGADYSVGDQVFTEKLFDTPAIRSLFRRHSLRNVDPRTEGYVRTFFCQGGYAVYPAAVNAAPAAESPEEIARLLRKFGVPRSNPENDAKHWSKGTSRLNCQKATLRCCKVAFARKQFRSTGDRPNM